MELPQHSRQNPPIRILAVLVAGGLLNIGLYFMLFIATPILTGFVIGALLRDWRDSALGGLLSSLVAFILLLIALAPLMLAANPVTNVTLFYLALLGYGFLLGLMGMVSALAGAIVVSYIAGS